MKRALVLLVLLAPLAYSGYLSGTRPVTKTFVRGQPVRNVLRLLFQPSQPAQVPSK